MSHVPEAALRSAPSNPKARSRATRRPTRPGVLASCMLVVAAGALVHCVDDESGLPAPGGGFHSQQVGEGGGDGEGGDLLSGPCDTEGETHECTTHHDAGCATGEQKCVGGEWSVCGPSSGSTITKRNLGTDEPNDCGAEGTTPNACDPECRAISPGTPDFGGGETSFDWETGSLGGLPAGATSAGLPDDCNDDRDCQFDHYCDEAADGGKGECVAWNPGQGNAACGADYDIAAGVPCEDVVPVCNRGNAPVPVADLNAMRIKWKAPPPYLMNGCSLGGPEGQCNVAATEPLAVGQCIDVSCNVPTNRVVFVDAGNGNSNECDCGNNWTFNVDGACVAPSCGDDVHVADEVDLTLFLSLDISGSMNFHRDCPYADQCTGRCDSNNCSGTCINSTTCSTYIGVKDQCCWNAPSVATSRWGAAREALTNFVKDDESAGLGIVMKFWPEGTCQASSCDAVEDFVDSGTCAHSPCEAAGVLADACAPHVEDVCSTNGLEYCCGENPQGTCAFSPCTTSSSTLASGCGGTGTPIRTATTATCGTKGFEGCCNGTTASGGNWGMNKAPCTATTSMTCRNATGASIACNSAAAAAAPTNTLTYAAYKTTIATPSCISNWTATCVTAFRTNFATYNNGRNPCSKAWDSGCVAAYSAIAGTTPGSSCTYEAWDATCVAALVGEGAQCQSTACNRPSLPSDCTSAGDCPLVLSDTLPDAAEDAIVAKLQTIAPVGGTPSAVAVEGAGDFCREYQEAHPTERCAVVFVSDGQPSQCGNANAVYSAASGAADDDVKVFSIGISGAGTSFMNTVAERGDTDSAIFISPDSTASSDFLTALEDIRNEFSCSYRIPAGAMMSDIRVLWHNGTQSPTINAVADLAACGGSSGGQYRYYPIDEDELGLCPTTCATIKARPQSSVEIINDCGASAEPVTVTDAFSAGDACDEYVGSHAAWTIMPYRAHVPPGSSIKVRARTRLTKAEAWGDFTDIVTITSANEISDLSNPPSLADALGTDALAEEIEVEFTTTVEGGAPEMLGYEMDLTCEYTE